VAYLAFSVPALAAGYATTLVGLHATIVVYSCLVILVGIAAFSVREIRQAMGRRRVKTAR
jgi:hypothetical protein